MKILIYIILFVFVFFSYVRYLEKTSLFYPDRDIHSTPKDIGLFFEDVYLHTEDGVKIHGWFIPAFDAEVTLLFLHGNAGNMSGRLQKIKIFNDIRCNIMIIDYRGFGKSEGKPTEKGMYADARAAYDYLLTRQDIDTKLIVGYGASLGGSALVDLATHRELAGLVIDSSFSNAVDMAKRIYPFIPSFMISIKLDSESKIKDMKIPKLFIHSKDDHTVPITLGKKLFDAAREPKQFVTISGDHNDAYLHDADKFVGSIERFVNQL